MKFCDVDYYRASCERIRQAEKLYAQASSYALAMYCGGLAVECLFRAFRWRVNKEFTSRHDLSDLLKASGILRVNDEYMRSKGKDEDSIRESSEDFRAAMNEVASLWRNDLRFTSEGKLKTHLVKIRRVQGVKGDPLKVNAADLINAAKTIHARGIVLWKSQTKS